MSGWTGTDPSKWAAGSDTLLTALLRNSVQGLAKAAAQTIPNGGRVPVKTGNLARSVVVSLTPPVVDAKGVTHTVGQNVSLALASLKPGEPIWIGWQARYSRRLNYGFVGTDSLGRSYNQSGYGFAEAAAAQWPQIVRAEAAKLGAR